MDKKYIWETASAYLRLLRSASNHEDKNVKMLELTLDQLALAYHLAEGKFVPGLPGPPAGDNGHYRLLASQRFPSFGLYNAVRPVLDITGAVESLLGDALDDLAEIALDLEKALWALDNTDEQDALWHFRHGYETRWGGHLRHLQLFIHAFKTERAQGKRG